MGGKGESITVKAEVDYVLDFSGDYSKEITPGIIRNYTKRSIDKRKFHDDNEEELKETIVNWYKDKNIKLEKEEVCSFGANGIFNLCGCFLQRGDKILVLSPNDLREDMFNLGGLKILRLNLLEENGYLPDLNEINQDIKMFFITNPNNPTGTVFPKVILKEIIKFCNDNKIILVCDEINLDVYFNKKIESILTLSKNLIVVNSPSNRSYMENYSVGFFVGKKELIEKIEKYKKDYRISSFMKDSLIAAYLDERHANIIRDNYRIKRNTICNALRDTGFEIFSEAGPFVWIRNRGKFLEKLVEEGIMVKDYGDYVRISLFPDIKKCKMFADIIRKI